MRQALLLLLAWPLAAGAAEPPDHRALKSYGFDASIPLPRVKPIPKWLLELWAETDEAPYEAYAASALEEQAVASAVANLPAPIKRVLIERLIGVYLVKGLKGNGLTNWVLDSSSRTYVYILLNPAGFQQTLSELMTERDLTLFRGRADLTVEAGAAKGILYTVAHESAHAFDYVKKVTPYVEPHLYETLHPGTTAGGGWDVWDEYSRPNSRSDYPLRTKLHFYGFGAPELDPAQAAELCAQWAGSPFASFYGSRLWAEDVAELFVLRHLTQDLGLPIRRVCAGKVFTPWDNPRVRGRAQRLLKPLYR